MKSDENTGIIGKTTKNNSREHPLTTHEQCVIKGCSFFRKEIRNEYFTNWRARRTFKKISSLA